MLEIGQLPEPAKLEESALAELIYDQVRNAVDLCRLIILEEDLIDGFRRALVVGGHRVEDAEALVARYMEDAWERVSAEVTEQLMEPEPMQLRAPPRKGAKR